MKTTKLFALMLAAAAVLPLAACKKEAATTANAEAAVLSAPADNDNAAWKKYLSGVVGQNLGTSIGNPFVYYLPSSVGNEKFEDDFAGQKDQVEGVVSRGLPGGSLIAFGSPESAKMAEIVVDAFAGTTPGSFRGVRVLFIGQAADSDAVKAAVEPPGAEYLFVEAK